ncbi:hormogonium polysaccharide biosynthesis glycosyltransferase HpsP [Leptolyngbya ohadii]|uniref:hormogonium polysaccharide biosynthesis glycosyltransferase HpsP n=1 Tax=Leptolyngbya ohadii TaxID=1962290 RepID=UPI000B59C3C5|nr:hormogonium polysaccharide biosynthesis glycosyltransferase HpsP [Leptolyngbya ohadii]
MEPLRILQIVPALSLVYGGPSQMVLGLSKALAAQGVEVTILTTNANGDRHQPPLDVPLATPIEQDGYRILYFSCKPFRRYKFSPELLIWLAAHAQDFDLAHIHACFSPVSTAAATIARLKNLPYIIRPLGTLDPADLQKKRLLKQIYGTLLERPNLAHAAALHFTSTQESQISHRFNTSTHDWIIPLGVDLPCSLPPRSPAETTSYAALTHPTPHSSTHLPIHPSTHPPIYSSTPHLLFLSRIDRKKGLTLLLPALEQLVAEGIDFRLTIAGSNPQDPEYEQSIHDRVKNSPLRDQTTFSGFVAGSEKWELLRSADLFVLPSYYENFGIAVVEAMAAGVPVLISDRVHIWQEIQASESGWICECEVSSLVDQLRSALLSPEERQRRGQNAQAYALSAYNWGKISDRMIQAYREVVEGKLA